MSRTIIYVHVYIILDFPITYRNALVLFQSKCACLHITVNIVVFLLKERKIPTKKGDHPCKFTELFLPRKKGNSLHFHSDVK